jgi:hypothetical protein
MIFSEDDLLGLLEPFGVPVVAFENTGKKFKFTAIFNKGQKVFDEMMQVIAMDTNLVCRTDDILSLDQQSPVTINNVKYKVRDLVADSSGISTIGILKI